MQLVNMKNLSALFHRIHRVRVLYRYLHETNSGRDFAAVTESNLKDKLNSFSIPFKDGYTCLHVKDCRCRQKKIIGLRDQADVFINKNTGFFVCSQCKKIGDWDLYINLITTKQNGSNTDQFERHCRMYDEELPDWNRILDQTEPLAYMTDDNFKKVLDEFKLPYCSRRVVEKLKIRINKDWDTLYFPVEISESVVGFKTYHNDGRQYMEPKVDCPGLLCPAENKCSSAVVVANISDYLALVSVNLSNFDIICLPYGASYISESCLPFIENYNKLILWLGEGNIEAVSQVAKKFTEERCYLVIPLDKQKSASVALSNNENIRSILLSAKHMCHKFVTTFKSFRDAILTELQNQDQMLGVQWKKFPALSRIFKGHRRGELTILSGPTGVGKTTFLSEYTLDLATQGVFTLWGSFEIKNTRLAKIMLTQFSGAPLTDNVDEYNVLCDRFEKLPLFFLTFHGQQSLGNIMDAVYHCSYSYDIAHVVIDNVQFMIDVSPDANQLDRFWKQDYMIQTFRSFASKNNCHVTLVMHPKKIEGCDIGINSIFGGVKATQEADNIMIIQKTKVHTFGTKKYLEVVKNRFTGDLGSFPLYFDKPSLSFSIKNKLMDGCHEILDDSEQHFYDPCDETIEEKTDSEIYMNN